MGGHKGCVTAHAGILQLRRLGGGAGRTRTTTKVLWNMVVSDQLPWSTPIQIAGKSKATWPRKARRLSDQGTCRTPTMFHNALVVMKYQKVRKSNKTTKRPTIWIGVRPGELVGHDPCSITLW